MLHRKHTARNFKPRLRFPAGRLPPHLSIRLHLASNLLMTRETLT